MDGLKLWIFYIFTEKSASTHSTPEHIPVLKISPIPSPKSSPHPSPIPSPQRSPQLSPHTSPLPSRRRNSAPGPADRPVDQEVDVSSGPFLSVHHTLPHAYSAAALQDLITNQSMSSLLSKEDIKVVNTSALLSLASVFSGFLQISLHIGEIFANFWNF